MAQVAGGPRSTRIYNPATEITVTGAVTDVKYVPHGSNSGSHLTIATDKGPTEVALGPSAFLSQKQFSVAKSDKISIIGSRVKIDGQDLVIAREVTKDGKTLTLRDKQGIPAWSRQR